MWKPSGNQVDMDVSHSESYLLYLDYKQRVFHIYADIFARGCVERVDLNDKQMHDLEWLCWKLDSATLKNC